MEHSDGDIEPIEEDLIDRKRGMLTKGDREFLWGVSDETLNENARNQKRYQIRRRVRDSIGDFAFLQSLPEEDIRLIFEEYHSDSPPLDLEWGVWAALQVLYAAIGRDKFPRLLESVIEVENMQRHPTTLVAADVEITVEEVESDIETAWSADDYEGPEDPELTDAAVEIMAELEDEDGVATETVLETIVDRHEVSVDEAEQAIQDALFTGQCYEPEEGMLKAI